MPLFPSIWLGIVLQTVEKCFDKEADPAFLVGEIVDGVENGPRGFEITFASPEPTRIVGKLVHGEPVGADYQWRDGSEWRSAVLTENQTEALEILAALFFYAGEASPA